MKKHAGAAMRVEGPAPFIIWTFRRTGGTNLGTALFERSSFTAVQQEPFNEDRLYGAVTAAFRKEGDDDALRAALADICARKVLIEHCVELMPPRMNMALADVSTGAGYRHVFLYRRHALGRLLSLHFAQRSGVWGRSKAGSAEIDERVFAEPLPVAALVAHEKDCRRRLRAVYQRLCALGTAPLLVAFEDIYAEADATLTQQRLLDILTTLSLSGGDASDREFAQRVAGGEQGTRDKYSRFSNYDELVQAVDALEEFDPAKLPVRVQVPRKLPAGLLKVAVWKPGFVPGVPGVSIAGVVLPEREGGSMLMVEDAAGMRPLQWELPSPNLAAQFPAVAAAARARFQASGLVMPAAGPIRLLWRAGDAAPFEFATITADGA